MRWLILIVACYSATSFANSNSNAEAFGTVVNQAQQTVNLMGGELPREIVGDAFDSCPTGQWGLHAGPTFTNTDWGDSSGFQANVFVAYPIGTGRCEEAQDLRIKKREWHMTDILYKVCKGIFHDGTMLHQDAEIQEECKKYRFTRTVKAFQK